MKKASVHTTIIVGAGFLGIETALTLARKKQNDLKIILISSQDHFTYYPGMYRVAMGAPVRQGCIPLSDIFEHYPNVVVVVDTITAVDPEHKRVTSSTQSWHYDSLVLGIGSEKRPITIPGLEEVVYSFRSIEEAIKLQVRIDTLFEKHANVTSSEDMLMGLHFVIVGGGPSGTELAGELSQYTHHLAKKYKIDPSYITIDIVEANQRILKQMYTGISEKVSHRLRELNVNIFPNRRVVQGESWSLRLGDMKLGTKTVIWAAGLSPSRFADDIPGVELNDRGKIKVDEFLRPNGMYDIYAGGDIADTTYSGLAQTSIHHGRYIADSIVRRHKFRHIWPYSPKTPAHNIPIGRGWAAFEIGRFRLYGFIPWLVRLVIDFRYYNSILPTKTALSIIHDSFSAKHLRS